jgi:hypothetical protein
VENLNGKKNIANREYGLVFLAALVVIMNKTEVTEHDLQAAVFEWAQLSQAKYPELRLLHAIPNGGGRGKPFITKSGKRLPPLAAVRLKAEGVKAGIPDIHLPVGHGGYLSLYIEMKRGSGVVSAAQKEVIELLRLENNLVLVCRSAEEAIMSLKRYLVSTR